MSDNIDIPVTVSGGEGIDRMVSSVDRLAESMVSLGSTSPSLDRLNESMAAMQAGMTSSLGALTQAMSEMRQVMATGFADISATNQKLIEAMGARQVRAIEETGDRAAASITAAGNKIKAADARTWEQIQRGSAANVTAAFAQLAEGIDIEAVLARYGELATGTALAFDGQLAALRTYQMETAAITEKGADKQLEVDREFRQAQLALASRAAAEMQALVEKRDLDEYRARSAASAELQALIEKRDTEEHKMRSAASAELQALIEKRDVEEYRTRAAAAAELQALIEKRDIEEYRIRSAASAELRALIEKRDVEEYQMRSAAAQRILEIEQRRDTELHAMRSAEAQKLAEIQQRRDVEEYTAAQTAAQRIIEIEQRRDMELHNMRAAAAVDAATQAERQRALNTNFLTASPASQVRTATQAQVYAGLGGDASAKYGSEAAGADALAQAQRRLAASAAEAAAAQARLGATSAEVGASQIELSGALRQAEGAFRGAAHEAGIYGLHHGQLIALLAGGAVAAALHHIAETGAEVEFQLASLGAMSGDLQPIDFNKFIGITSGSMTSLKDAAEGVHALAQAGMDQAKAYAVLPDVMRLASIGEMSVGQAAEMAIESMHAFGKEAYNLGDIGDILVAVGSKANVSVHKLAEDMKSAAVTGELFNLDMKEITATVGVLAERGLTIQPLSSALNKLYEPSAKTAKVMADMGLSTKEASGELKTYTEFVKELSAKVGEYKNPGDPLKMLGMSTQSIKAMEVMTQHTEDYLHLLHEAEAAHDKMFNVMTAKEDTVEGAWKRLGSTVEGTLTKAFVEASPVIRVVEEDLMHLAGDESTANALANLASGVARLTQFFVENAGTLVKVVAAYVGLRMISGLTTLLAEFTAAQVRQTAVTEAAVVATATQTTQLELFAVAETEAGVAGARLAAGMEAGAAGARLLSASFGWISLAVVAAISAVDLLTGSMDKQDAEHLKQQNSFDSTSDAIQREIDRLKDLEEQMRKTGKAGVVAAAEVALAYAQEEQAKIQGNLDAARESMPVDTSLRMAGRHGPTSRNGEQMKSDAVVQLEKDLKDAETRTVGMMNKVAELTSRQEAVEALTKVKDLQKDIENLPHGEIKAFAKTKAAEEAAKAANEGLKALRAEEVTEGNVLDLAEKYKVVKEQILATKLNGSVGAAAEHPDKSGFRAEIELLQEQHRLKELDAKSDLADAKSENKRGELGDLELINRELEINKGLHTDALNIAQQEYALAQKSGKKIDIARADSRVKTAEKQIGLDDTAAAQAKDNLFSKMDQVELQHQAKTLASKGDLLGAYNKEWEAKNGTALDVINADIKAATSDSDRERFESFKATLLKMREEGQKDAIFKMDTIAFDADVEHMQTKLADLKAQLGAGAGLGQRVDVAFATQATIQQALPQQQADYEKAKTDAGDDPAKLKQVDSMLKKIQSETAELNNVFVSLGQTIAQSLTDAFGKGGTAMGGMITTAVAYDAQLKTIQTTLAESAGTDADKAAASQATAAAQIKAYGSMAGAASGFFDTNSKGYKMLHAAEQAFRVFELAMAVSTAVKKIALEGTVTAATEANTVARTTAIIAGEEGAAAATVAGAETAVAANQVEGQSAALVGVANQAKGEPYSAWARMAAMAAAMAALGFAVGGVGGGSDNIAADRQASQGTGTVLGGGTSAKSESIAKSIELTAENSSTQINYLAAMSASLQAIQSNITNFAAQVVKTTDLGKADFTGSKGGAYNFGASTFGVSVMTGGLGTILDKLSGGLVGKIGGTALNAIFGGKTKLTDSGFTMDKANLGTIENSGANVKQYVDVTRSGGWFSGDKTSTSTQSLGTEANRQFSQIITSMADAVRQAGSLLGASGDAFSARLNGFVVDIGAISLKGLTSDEIQKQLDAVFSKVGDQLAQAALPDLQKFQQVGEGYLQTLVRVAADYAKVDASLQSIGMAFGAVGVTSIAAREDLVKLAGGVDKFQSATADFATNFLTKAQQQAPVLAFVNQQLGGMNLGWVTTREQFAKVVTGLDLTTEAGRQTYSSLMGLESAFAATHAAIVDTSKSAQDVADERKDLQDEYDQATMTSTQLLAKQRDALDESNRALFDQVQALKAVHDSAAALLGDVDTAYSTLSNVIGRQKTTLQTQIDTETAAVSKLSTISQSVKSTIESLTEQVPEDAAAKRHAAQDDIRSALAAMKSGGTLTDDQITSLKASLTAVTKDSTGQFSSYQDYLKDQYETKNDITALGDVTDKQLSVEQQQLDADKAQVKAWDQMLADAKDQVDALKGIDTKSMSIIDALNNLATMLARAAQNPIVAATPAISDAYQTSLYRAPDADGLKYWQNRIAMGSSIDQVTSEISSSPEAQVESLYKSILGRTADAGGLSYWEDRLKGGSSIALIQQEIANSPEAKKNTPGFAIGGDHEGGLRLVGENGPELEATGPAHVYSNSQTMAMLSQMYMPAGGGGGDAATQEMVKQLIAEIKMLREYNSAENVAQVKQLQNTVDLLQRVIFGGDAIQTKAAA